MINGMFLQFPYDYYNIMNTHAEQYGIEHIRFICNFRDNGKTCN